MVAIAAVIFGLLISVSGIWLYRTVRNTVASIEITEVDLQLSPEPEEVSADGFSTPQPLPGPVIIVTDPARPGVEITATPAPLIDLSLFDPWEGTERINVLLLGIDTRCEDEGPTRTDSMILMSIDPVDKTASGLSLPRDLWVEIPAFGPDRINKANYLGELNEYPSGGTGLAMETVENFLGVRVDHYLAVNFEAFRDFINLIDGIQVEVPETINDPTYPDECYGYDPFFMREGLQSLNGPLALKYARTRVTDGGDIDRAERQQAVILAVRQKLLDVNMIPKLIARAPLLYKSFQKNVKTSFTETEVIQLGLLVQEIERSDIKMGVIDYNYVNPQVTFDNQYVLLPNYNYIAELRAELFPPIAAPPQRIDDLPDLVLEEGARVAVWNGTQTFGLAAQTQTYLEEIGINVVEVDNAESAAYPTTEVIDYGRHEYTTLFLTQAMDLPPLNVKSGSTPEGDFDVLVILGYGWEVPGAENGQ